ncbi:hypothetical protein Pan216_17860 [Planctomycetes bacterium Pan216]|uniref:Uncharacterized protein n=1 Tax=Kolteria novifilia TaxID=2527975 RepID=A0A518B1S8_9BACT|nr:hypothetical protein Pan216_17860 [Planctomycetes bacterium Pan216]
MSNNDASSLSEREVQLLADMRGATVWLDGTEQWRQRANGLDVVEACDIRQRDEGTSHLHVTFVEGDAWEAPIGALSVDEDGIEVDHDGDWWHVRLVPREWPDAIFDALDRLTGRVCELDRRHLVVIERVETRKGVRATFVVKDLSRGHRRKLTAPVGETLIASGVILHGREGWHLATRPRKRLVYTELLKALGMQRHLETTPWM